MNKEDLKREIGDLIWKMATNLMTEAGVPDADYLHMSDAMAENARSQIVKAKGFFILPSQLFRNVADGPRTTTS